MMSALACSVLFLFELWSSSRDELLLLAAQGLLFIPCTLGVPSVLVGGEIVSTFGHPEKVRLGSCKLIEEVMIGEDKLIRFSGMN